MKKVNDNGTTTIIDALLTRINELNRFSDDEIVIKNRELLPFDVVVDEYGRFGFVHDVFKYKNADDETVHCVHIAGDAVSYRSNGQYAISTIYETESLKARCALIAQSGGKND